MKKDIFNPFHNTRGFTLLEVVAILVIIGILTAVAISKATSTDSYRLIAETETLKTHLRFTQFRAMGDTVPWGITIEANSYTLLRNGVISSFILPNDNSATHTFQSGVSVSSGIGTIVTYDEWGSPGSAPITITLSAGSASQTITITKNTGFIP